ncbi:murein L,D-transpeptidase family protein [Thiomicrorhabdus sp. 6S3-12]|uniref:L,D-transpeptidase family protein n=1 Tax=Thiomicrorhabdus sp. 6S3-12 TaxID=2819681 RepID=UPI001AADACB9|nr:L,D-transpeptidase [Thiomicrorhabdus sp. 6S3-12]MBO1923041.1 L,D-transpeptidase [Thiomicrorhabdus sp. 6S3-12]
MLRKTKLVFALSLAASLQVAQADEVLQVEQKLLSGLQSMQSLSFEQALNTFDQLSEEHPTYKLVQLVKADLLALKAGQPSMIDAYRKAHKDEISKLEDEAKVRWEFAQGALQQNSGFDHYVLKAGPQKNIVIVNLQESRLYLFGRNAKQQIEQLADYYVTIGAKGAGKQREGDQRTPIGVYHVVDMISDDKLPDLYGVGALPLNYPNKWDQSLGKTGSGIWLHGVPRNTYTRAPRSSRGCVVLNNSAMQKLLSEYKLPLSTPILIVDEESENLNFSLDSKYLVKEVRAWLGDNQPEVDWSQVSVYLYPNEKDLFYVTYPAKEEDKMVHQFWRRDMEGDWKVVLQDTENNEIKYVFRR